MEKWIGLLLVVVMTVISAGAVSTALHLQEIEVILENDRSDNQLDFTQQEQFFDDVGIRGNENRRARSSRMSSGAVYVNELNRLRRLLNAPDMYYTSLSSVLASKASELTKTCQLQTRVKLPVKSPFSVGLTGYTSSVVAEFNNIYNNHGTDSSFYWQLMSPRLLYAGCAMGQTKCNVTKNHSSPSFVFACLFSYSRPVVKGRTRSNDDSATCSLCDYDALWCDEGLCRISCSPNSFACGYEERMCESFCSNCSRVARNAQCSCICHYNNNQIRCRGGDVEMSTEQNPICKAAKKRILRKTGWISLTVFAIVAIILLIVIIACIVRLCRLRKRSLRRRSSQSRSADDVHASSAATGDFSSVSQLPSFVGSPFVLSPPPYVDGDGPGTAPPPYFDCPSYQAAISNTPKPFEYTLSDLPPSFAVAVQPSAPGPSGVDDTAAYRNPAFSEDTSTSSEFHA